MFVMLVVVGLFLAVGRGAELPAADGGVQVQLIGADGITQVAAAQALGLSGRGVRLCVIDGPIDIRHPTFGTCRSPGRPVPPECRVFTAYNADTGAEDVEPPYPLGTWDMHGTHTAGIAVGSFPFKLKDKEGLPLPHQRGVAYGAMLGAFNYGAFGKTAECMKVAEQRGCDIVSMSFGLAGTVAGNYPQAAGQAQLAALQKADIIAVAAASNEGSSSGGSSVFTTGVSPGSLQGVISVASVENTAQPGSLVLLDQDINTPAGPKNTLEAFLRVDTLALTYDPLTNALNLPQQLVLLRSLPQASGCAPPTAITKTANLAGKIFVLQVAADCLTILYEDEQSNGAAAKLWKTYKALKPALTLFALPNDAAAFECAARLQHKAMPMLWLRSDDGAALAAALAAEPSKVLRLLRLPGATVSEMPANKAGQPLEYSSMGPTLNFSVKPDIAAPGTLYSSAPDQTYAPLTGTSMACPYVSGVVALWREHMTTAGIPKPPGGWVAAAAAALKNTAKPLPFPHSSSSSSSLMYPPAKIGAGLVQAHAAVVTPVSITPAELPLRTDTRSQTVQLTLTNKGRAAVTYIVGHKPAVGISLTKAWFRKAYDVSIPAAVVAPIGAAVTVPARGSIVFKVTISLPPALRQLDDAIFSGFITFTPTNRSSSSSSSSSRRSSTAVPLSVPYQGASRDYSRIDSNSSLALFARPLPAFDPVASTLLQNRPPMYICNPATFERCDYQQGAIDIGAGYSIRIAATFVRPLQQVRLQLYDGRNGTHLGTQDFGACRAAAPVEVTTLGNCDRLALSDPFWFGEYDRPDGSRVDFIEPGLYRLKALLYAPLAVAEAAAGRQPQRRPFVVDIPNLLRIVKEA